MAEDLAQVSFVKLWQALPRYDGRAALATLLYTITRNTCLSELRKRGRMVSLDALTEADNDDDAPSPAATGVAAHGTAPRRRRPWPPADPSPA